mmetsp:Transcript_51578/g.102455  ORF Transcript_51578/g.102455 Transcript_51578/m.102455 type:complete len:713 (+) Transcript_51578:77-2215(+)
MVEPQEDAFSEESDCDAAAEDNSTPDGLSYVGEAARGVLSEKHAAYRNVCWNVTHGKVVGEIAQTPPREYWKDRQINDDCETCHSDSFPEKMGEIISKATEWVDFTSLGPPDGKFLDCIAKALKALSDSGNSVTVRFLVGNIVGMPTDDHALCRALTKHPDYELPDDSNIRVWVGSWRKGVSWNHAKIIAVDGKYLFTGGHNVWDPHYLKKNPVRDLSMEAEGQVTQDGHVFANRMWQFIIKKHKAYIFQTRAPDWVPMLYKSRIAIAHWPPSLEDYPPLYEPSSEPLPIPEAVEQGDLPMITCGRYGTLHHDDATANPSDSAIVAMLKSAQKSIKMSLQDLGPLAVVLGGRPRALPGGVWPEAYLREIACAIYERGVDVEIVLSNPNSIPSNLTPLEANYGNGWTCEDVASEIIKAIQSNIQDVDEERLSGLVGINLRLAYLRTNLGTMDWQEKKKAGNHAKFFVVDDICYYIGSQNLYIANLAEWGIIIDNEEQTQKVLEEYWNPLWEKSYLDVPEDERDFNVDNVLAGLELDRNPQDFSDLSPEELEAMLLAKKAARGGGSSNNLMVWLKRASNLKNADGLFSGSSDSYVTLRLVDGDGKTVSVPQQSKVIPDGGPNPHWNEQFVFEGLDTPAAYTLKVSVLDKDSLFGLEGQIADYLAMDDKLGAATVDLGTLANTTEFQEMEIVISDGWFSDSTVSLALNTHGGWGN